MRPKAASRAAISRIHSDTRVTPPRYPTRINIAICCTLVAIALQSAVAQDAKLEACNSPEYHQFDFWIGDWDVLDADSTSQVARVKVERILDGCVLHEVYEDNTGLKGESLSIYDRNTKRWRQSWVTNKGQLLVVEGGLQAGVMVLSGADQTATGRRLVRAAWKRTDSNVRESAVRSTDAGKTWQPWFDLIFRPHKQ